MALWRGPTVEPAQAVPWRFGSKPKVVEPAKPKGITTATKGAILISTGSAVVFAVSKILSNKKKDVDLDQLRKTRQEKLDSIEVEMKSIRETEQISLEVEHVNVDEIDSKLNETVEAESSESAAGESTNPGLVEAMIAHEVEVIQGEEHRKYS